MRTATRSYKAKVLIGMAALASLVLGPPVSAQTEGEVTGAGAGTGFEYASPGQINNCPGQELTGTFPGSRFELTHEGTYDGAATDAQGVPTTVASYAGPTEVMVETGPYIINPEGTYTTCTLPGPVPINKASIKGTSPLVGGDVDCPDLDGTFQRRAFDVVEFRLTGKCTVEGNVPELDGQVTDQDTTHVITGVMHPCYAPLPVEEEVPPEGCQVDPDASAILVTDYVVLPGAVSQAT